MPKTGENIYHRKDGRWEARYVRCYKNGKPQYGYLYAPTYTEVKAKKTAVMSQPQQAKIPSYVAAATFDTLAKLWLSRIRISVKESTYTRYVRNVETYLLPLLGSQKLFKLEDAYMNRLPEILMKEGGRRGQGLSAKTVSDILSVLKAILKFGEENHFPVPCTEGMKYPPKSKSPIEILTQENRKKIENKIIHSEDNVSLGILFILFTGVRVGELCGLRWGDIDFESGIVTICRTVERITDLDPLAKSKTKVIVSEPKTENSIRSIPLSSYIYDYLCAHRKKPNCYLLTGCVQYMEPHQFYTLYQKYLKELGLPRYTVHSLRHTFATQCVELGFDPKSLSEILGHSSIVTTMSIYVHPTMQQKKEQMNRLSLGLTPSNP